MLVLTICLGLFFAGVGFVLTTQNASSLLAGYNTMSTAERDKVDIEGYIPFFRKFHWFLGASTILLSLAAYFFLGDVGLGYVIGLYPLLAYIYFIPAGQKYYHDSSNTWASNIAIGVLIASAIAVGLLLYLG